MFDLSIEKGKLIFKNIHIIYYINRKMFKKKVHRMNSNLPRDFGPPKAALSLGSARSPQDRFPTIVTIIFIQPRPRPLHLIRARRRRLKYSSQNPPLSTVINAHDPIHRTAIRRPISLHKRAAKGLTTTCTLYTI